MNPSHTTPQSGLPSGMNSNDGNNSNRQVDIPLGPLDDSRKFFLANMAYHFSALDAKQWFGRFGTVNHVKIIYDKTGQSKGYGFLYMHTAEGSAAVDAFAESQNFKINMMGRSNVHCTRHDHGRVKPQYNNTNTNNHRQQPKRRSYSNASHNNLTAAPTTTTTTATLSPYGGVSTNVTNNVPANNSATNHSPYSTNTNNSLQSTGPVSYIPQNPNPSTTVAMYTAVTPQPQQQQYQPHHVTVAAPTSTSTTTVYHQPQQPPVYNTNHQLTQQPPAYDPNYNTAASTNVNIGAPYEHVVQPQQQQQQHYGPPPPPPPQQQQQQQQAQPQYSYNSNVSATSYQQQTQPVANAYTQPPTYAPPKNTYNDPAVQQTSYNNNNNNMGAVYNSNLQTVVPQQTAVSNIPPPPPPPQTKILLSNLPPTVQPSDVVSWLMTDLSAAVSRCTLEFNHSSNSTLAHLTVPTGSTVILELSRQNQLLFKNQIVYATADANPPSDGRAIPIGMGAPVTSSTPTIKPSQQHNYRGGKGKGGRGGGGHNRGFNPNRNRHHQPY